VPQSLFVFVRRKEKTLHALCVLWLESNLWKNYMDFLCNGIYLQAAEKKHIQETYAPSGI
jgi:hypothetical protein